MRRLGREKEPPRELQGSIPSKSQRKAPKLSCAQRTQEEWRASKGTAGCRHGPHPEQAKEQWGSGRMRTPHTRGDAQGVHAFSYKVVNKVFCPARGSERLHQAVKVLWSPREGTALQATKTCLGEPGTLAEAGTNGRQHHVVSPQHKDGKEHSDGTEHSDGKHDVNRHLHSGSYPTRKNKNSKCW